jgi:ribosomal 50S subunit-recycling heat shock protein
MSRKAMQAKQPVEKQPLTSMRLDKFLKISRIIKRRSVANDACSTGHVTVNGKEGKPGTDVRVGDVLGIRFGDKYSEYEILSIAEHAAKQDAASMYRAKP